MSDHRIFGFTSYVLISSLSSLKESRAAAASTEIDIIPSTSYQQNNTSRKVITQSNDSDKKKWLL